MKRYFSITLTVFMLLAVLSGCSQSIDPASDGGEPAFEPIVKIKIVSTIFPQYDWVREIIGDRAEYFELTLLVDSYVDLHSYQPSVSDIAKVSACDLFIYVGGHSDKWVENALKQAMNSELTAISLVEVLGDAVKTERLSGGMTHACDDDDCDYDHGSPSVPEEEHEDEHVWLSLRTAQVFCEAITEAIIQEDPENAEVYRNNLSAYIEKLKALDAEFTAMADEAEVKTVVFGDRFPFLYLVDDYGIDFYAAFSGCSAETEASFSTIVTLAGKMDSLNLTNIMVTESANQSIAETIISNTKDRNQKILVLDAMQSVTAKDVNEGVTYLSVMESNLEVLREALR